MATSKQAGAKRVGLTQLLTEEELAKLRPRRKFVLDLEANITTSMAARACSHEVGSIAVLMAIAEREQSTDRALHSMASTSARSMQSRRQHLPSSKGLANTSPSVGERGEDRGASKSRGKVS